MNSNCPGNTQSVEQFIIAGRTDEMTYSKFAILDRCVDQPSVIYARDNIIYDYLDEIKSLAVQIELTDREYIKYRYNPKRFAFDIYGSTELYFIILAVNGICSSKDFNRRKIKALYKSDVIDILNAIYNAESQYIDKNRNYMSKE